MNLVQVLVCLKYQHDLPIVCNGVEQSLPRAIRWQRGGNRNFSFLGWPSGLRLLPVCQPLDRPNPKNSAGAEFVSIGQGLSRTLADSSSEKHERDERRNRKAAKSCSRQGNRRSDQCA